MSANTVCRHRYIVLCIAFICILAGPPAALAETPVYHDEPSGEFLRQWLICGPYSLGEVDETDAEVDHLPGFEQDFLHAHGGETNPSIVEGQTDQLGEARATWMAYESEEPEIDLDIALSNEESVVGYGYCEIESTEDRICILALGTNDGCRVWLNGEQVWDYTAGRGLSADDDLLAVMLRKGRNKLLLKVEERGANWGFTVRFLPLDPASFAGKFQLFKVVTPEDGHAVLHFIHPMSVAQRLVRNTVVTIRMPDAPDAVVWQGPWTQQATMPLDTGAKDYGHYELNIDTQLVDGSKWTRTMPFAAGKRIDYVLFEDGRTGYAIVVGEDASESEQWAASELQHWLREVSGAVLPIRAATEPAGDSEIVIGYNARTGALLGADVTPPADTDESFMYRNVGRAILIAGGRDRGTMYGVFSFLERELGCRWYTPAVSVAPRKDRLAFDYLRHAESPGVRVRNDFYYEAFDPTWAARNRINGELTFGAVREQHGGVETYWGVHTFYHFMPPDEFFESHPEYYSLLDGQRVHERAQLCLTNPDVLRIITERLLDYMRENPEHLIYSVSQNDWRNPCQCAKCQAIAEREQSESGPVIWFVNQVAEAVEAEFPEKFVGTLAYDYTRKPCKNLKPRQNVVIRFCSIECCFSHDFHHCPENASFVDDIQGWAAIAPHLYIWDYVVNFGHYIMPYPNFPVLQPNIQTFRDHNAIGIMEQAAYQSRGGEFAELRAYVIARLLWNPEGDVDYFINDFMYGYYGRSGQHVRRYFDLLHAQVTPTTHIHLGLGADDPLFTDAFVREAGAIFDEAETVAPDETIRQRVEMARLPLMYLKCLRAPVDARTDGTYARFCTIVEREGITHYAEGGQPHKTAFHLKTEKAR